MNEFLSEETRETYNKVLSYWGPIKCAALRKDNIVYTGKTHGECLLQKDKGVLRNAEQGFVTENKRFVNREMALILAEWYNQIDEKHPPMDQLLSEDLKEIDVIKV